MAMDLSIYWNAYNGLYYLFQRIIRISRP